MLNNLLLALCGGLLVWWLVRTVKTQRGLFTRENFTRSATTLGFLALMLIGVVALCVFLLKAR